ncbi:centromere-associated protein E isoform X6 [Coregonus clupeaformis]|uniref:centromere-associated protein E isoform X6 n=1 Tax=Coregonus clupeaformis TaxID=59861 RepID=UPI001E1C338E|nr:centromere-associated protein E isoform X6 [Coregonus clupeaformis]
MAEESAVKVCVRVRPLIEREETAAESAEPVKLYWKTDKQTIHQVDDGNFTKNFSFDRVFSAEETTLQLYQELAKPLVVSTVEGYNGTIFAYGQTSSGKTFTMMGSSLTPGVIPLAMEDVFQTIKNCPKKEFLLRVSYLEIYNETVTDLLCDSWKRKPLEIREGNNKNVYVADLTEELVTSPEQALAWIRKGEKNRHYGKTKMNQRSSRSHTIFRMILESRDRGDSASGENSDGAIIVSHLNLVDLAGAERASQTGAEGTRFKEGCNINRSLFTLGQVIKKLSDETQKGFTNYRDSKLTRILQNSLGGNAKTVIICTITPVTLEETLSTLQFASAAKNMKNDPHVTEVSDDGALLRRYRNEIVDLKRRLHEVSSVTQTTATEKETLSQILQEKDQLQREQEDRIKNLTKLLVTSSNFVTIKKMPKRRVTWGGKLPSPAFHHAGESDLSFAEPFLKKRKADMSVLTEQNEDGEELDSTFDMEMNQSSLTVRGFAESEFFSPNQLNKLSEKVSCLELQLENETQQKQEAMEKVETFQRRVAELETQLEEKSQMPADAQLEIEVQQNQEAMEKVATFEMRVAELEKQLEEKSQMPANAQAQEAMEKVETFERRVAELETQLEEKSQMPADAQLEIEVQQNQEAMEKVATFERRVAELEKQLEEKSQMPANAQAQEAVETFERRVAELETQLEEKSQMPTDAQEQMKKGFEETIQLCETLVSEKEMVATERDYLKQELNILMEQTENLKKEKAALLQEMEEKKEIDEFNSLEEESKREYEKELLNDISSLKKAMEASGRKSQELEANLLSMSEELKKKGDWAEELQRSSDIDLVQQVKQLRRSLDDAEGLSRDTKKEWAHLRSENISLKERAVTITAGYERMEAEVNGLRYQLETEKSRFKKMQVDLQRELQGAFEENTKLTTLLDGKVPKNLIDRFELEKTVADLKKELEKSHEDERTLQAKIEDLSALQDLPDKVDSLMKQVCDLTEELCAVQQEKDMLVSAKACSEEEAHQLRENVQSSQEQLVKLLDDLSKAELRENNLTQQCADITEQLETLRKDLERSSVENSQLLTTVEESSLRLKENEERRASIEDQLCGMQQVMKELEEKLADSESSKEQYDNLSQERQDQIRQLSEELIQVQAELKRQHHLNSEQQACAQQDDQHQLQIQELRAALESVTEERCQLNSDLQQNMEMAAETQGCLHSIQEELRQQRQLNSDLENQRLQKETLLEQQMKQLSDELESVQAERELLLSEKTTVPQNHAELEKLLSTVTSLTEERDQLQEILGGVREERNQLKRNLEENVEMIIQVQTELKHQQHLNSEQQTEREHQEAQLRQQIQQLGEELEIMTQERRQLKGDLQENLEMAAETQGLLHSIQEELRQQRQLNSDLESQSLQKESLLEQQAKQLSEELESVRAERERLLSEKTDSPQNHAKELEKLLSTVTSLTEERDQLQEILEGVREERNQFKRDLEENVEMSIKVQDELKHQQHLNSEQQTEREHQEAQLQQQIQQLGEELEIMTQERRQLKGDLQENLEMAAETQGLLHSIQEELRQQRQLNSDLESQSLQKESLLEQQAKQLSEELESVRAERERLLSEKTDSPQNHAKELEKLLSTVTSLTEERDQLQEILEGVREERNQFKRDLEENVEMSIKVQDELKHQQHLNSEQQTEREHQEAQLQQQIQQLGEELEIMTQERRQLKGDLQENLEMAAETQGLLHSIQEELRQQRQLNSDLESQSLQKESLLEQQAKQLSEELESVRAERERLLSEKTDSPQNHAKELEKLLSTVTSLTEERDQLQEILEGVREERNQLKRDLKKNVEMMQQLEEECTYMRDERTQIQGDLQENMEMVIEMQRTLEQQRHLNSQQQAESEQQEAQLKQQVQHLEEQLEMVKDERSQLKSNLQYNMDMMKLLEEEFKGFKEGQSHFKVEAETSHKMLSDANATISILTEQINNLEQSTNCCTTRAGEGLCSRLEASTQQLQVSFMRFQLVINGASKPGHGPLIDVTRVEEVMILKLLPLLPKPTKKIHSNVNRSTVQITNTVWDTKVLLKLCAKDYKTHFEALVQNDLAVFEERRLQDLLLCRAQAPSHSVKVAENDFLGVWDERLSELLDRREDYLQKMNSVLKKLEESLAAHPAAVSEELSVRERSNEELSALCMVHSPDSAAVESFLERELARRSALAQANTLALQGLRDERCGLLRELGVVRAQADSQLKEERSKTSTLLQILERAPVKTEADLLRDNQQLALQRQQLDGEIKEMQMRVEQLEEDQIKAADSVSNHKQATQLLQTELQDACAKVKDREGSIQILKEKLRETEVLAKRRASPSALELEELKAKVVKMELETTASSSKHQEELLRMTTVLNHKEDALRTLKETLRRSRQEGEQSFNEGQDLHARLTTTRGRTVQSNILLEKNKLEEEVKRLQSNISELESLVSTQQGEITKWKARAIKLKEKRRDLVDKPLSPCTPTKRHLPMSSEDFLNSPKRFLDSPKRFLDSPKRFLDSPKRFLDSPKRFLDSPKKFLDSPKSKFFDVRPGSESMSINCPKQFFDNSNLGTIQEVAGIPISDMEADGSAEEGNWWNVIPCVWDKTQCGVITNWSTNTFTSFSRRSYPERLTNWCIHQWQPLYNFFKRIFI